MRYLLLTATRTRAPLAPLAVSLFSVIGVFLYRGNEVGRTWGLTAVLTCGLAAWLVAAVLAAEPESQSDMAVAALGGRARRLPLDVALCAAASAGLTVAFIGYPMALIGLLGIEDEFDRAVALGDVAAAALAHLSSGMLGGAVAVLFAPPRVARRASGVAAILGGLVALAALGGAAGPAAAASELGDAPAGTVTGGLALACLGCLALAAAAFAAATWWGARAG